MNVKKQVGTAVAIAAGMLIATGSAGAGGKLDTYRDGPERSDALTSGKVDAAAAIRFFRASEGVRMSSPGSTGAASYVDGSERGGPYREASPAVEVGTSSTSGFDWGSAAIGASSALIVALLLGASLIGVRHSRSRPVAR